MAHLEFTFIFSISISIQLPYKKISGKKEEETCAIGMEAVGIECVMKNQQVQPEKWPELTR